MRRIIGFLCALIWMTAAVNSYASIMDPPLGTRAAGLGNAMAGLADDLISALYYNPAGISQIEEGTAVFDVMISDNRFRVKGKGPYRGYSENNAEGAMIPLMGWMAFNNGKWGFALGLYSTLGIGFRYRADPESGVMGEFKNLTGVMTFAPTLSYKLHPTLSIGIQPNIGYGKAEIDFPTPHGHLKTDSDGFGYGCTLGLLYQPASFLSIGVRWKSPMVTRLEGDADLGGADGTEDDAFDLDFYWPQMIDFGIAVKIRENLTLTTNIKWTDWSYFERSKFAFERYDQFSGSLLQNVRDNLRWGVGIEYSPKDFLDLRIGYLHDGSSVKADSISPLIPEAGLSDISAGMGIRWDKFQFDTMFGYTFYRGYRRGHGTFPMKVEGFMPFGGVALTYTF